MKNKRKYNTLLQSVKDVEIIDKRTKIVHLKYISKKWGISFLERFLFSFHNNLNIDIRF